MTHAAPSSSTKAVRVKLYFLTLSIRRSWNAICTQQNDKTTRRTEDRVKLLSLFEDSSIVEELIRVGISSMSHLQRVKTWNNDRILRFFTNRTILTEFQIEEVIFKLDSM